jgi:hypothetical protein
VSVKITKDNVRSLIANIEQMSNKRVFIGIPGEASARPGQPISNAQIGYINEFGSPINNIPAAPHLRPGVEAALPAITAELEKAAVRALKTPAAYGVGLERAGIRAVASVRKQIVSQEGFSELAKGTLRARARKGFKGTKRLIQTGQYLNAITHVVRAK